MSHLGLNYPFRLHLLVGQRAHATVCTELSSVSPQLSSGLESLFPNVTAASHKCAGSRVQSKSSSYPKRTSSGMFHALLAKKYTFPAQPSPPTFTEFVFRTFPSVHGIPSALYRMFPVRSPSIVTLSRRKLGI